MDGVFQFFGFGVPSQHDANNNATTNSTTGNGTNPDGTSSGQGSSRNVNKPPEERDPPPIAGYAAPSHMTAIGVQPFDAVFPPDGEHQVYAEEESFDFYRLVACAVSLRVIGLLTVFTGLAELGVGIWVASYIPNVRLGSWWAVLLPVLAGERDCRPPSHRGPRSTQHSPHTLPRSVPGTSPLIRGQASGRRAR